MFEVSECLFFIDRVKLGNRQNSRLRICARPWALSSESVYASASGCHAWAKVYPQSNYVCKNTCTWGHSKTLCTGPNPFTFLPGIQMCPGIISLLYQVYLQTDLIFFCSLKLILPWWKSPTFWDKFSLKFSKYFCFQFSDFAKMT